MARKMKISPAVLLGGAALGAFALSRGGIGARAAGAGQRTSAAQRDDASDLEITREKLLEYRDAAIAAGISGKFYLVNGVPIWTYLNKQAPSFVKDDQKFWITAIPNSRVAGPQEWQIWDGSELIVVEPGKISGFAYAKAAVATGKKYEADVVAWKQASTAAWKKGEGLTQKNVVPGTDEPLATDEGGDPIVSQGGGYPYGYMTSANGKRIIPLGPDGLPAGRFRRTLNSIGRLFKDTAEAVDNLGSEIKGGIGKLIGSAGERDSGGSVEEAQSQGDANGQG